MARVDRYQLAVLLAQEILAEPVGNDEDIIEQAVIDLRDEIEAGRRNQQDMASVNSRTAELLRQWGYSIKAPDEQPRLRVIR